MRTLYLPTAFSANLSHSICRFDGSRAKLVWQIKIKCCILVCIHPPIGVEWKEYYLKKGHGGAISYSTILYFGLLGQVVCRVDWRVHSLHCEEGSQVGSVWGDYDQCKEPPYSTNYPCREGLRHQFRSCEITQGTLLILKTNTSWDNDDCSMQQQITMTHTTETSLFVSRWWLKVLYQRETSGVKQRVRYKNSIKT